MKYIQYAGPFDSLDVSNVIGKQGSVFYTPGTGIVAPDQRGNVVQVTNEAFDELMTYPGHRFVEVADADAKALIDKQSAARKVREQQQALFEAEPANAGILVPSIQQQLQAVPSVAEIAPSAAATSAQIKAETRASAQSAQPANSATVVGE